MLMDAINEGEFLPLYFGWLGVLGIKKDGNIVRFDAETGEITPVVPSPANRLYRLALFQGIKKYPQLITLLPGKPNEALTCDSCGGSGKLANENMVCICCGSGWTLKDDFESSPVG